MGISSIFLLAPLLTRLGSSAPEYAIDEQLDPSSDMYSLGCIIYAVHVRGNPPFKNHGSLQSLRDNAGKPLVGMEKLDPDLQGHYLVPLGGENVLMSYQLY